MAADTITPPPSGTATPTTTSLTKSQIASAPANGTHAANGNDGLSPLRAADLKITYTTSPRPVPHPASKEIAESNICTDHMITCEWNHETGWDAPELCPYGPLSIMPTASVLHYATECFEGLKLYRGHDDRLRVFRVNKNCERMRRSAARIALPDFDAEELAKLIIKLCSTDGPKWLPKKSRRGGFLYLRPTFIGTDPTLGVQMPKRALLYIIIACFPDLSNSKALEQPAGSTDEEDVVPGLQDPKSEELKAQIKKDEEMGEIKGLKLLASSEDTIRAWPGGFGFAKLGANYGPSLMAQGEARRRGYNQILWLFGKEAFVTEAGASNFFVVMKNKEGKTQLITAPLEQKIILEGVTRASIIQLAQERLAGEVEVVERTYTMQEVDDAVEEGRLLEAFAAGTAFFVAPVGLIEWKGKELRIPTSDGDSGPITRTLRDWLAGIMYGTESHEWGIVVPEGQ